MNNTWKIIPDDRVRHVWADPNGENEIYVNPTFYAQAGTPICDFEGDFEGDDMIYVRTEVLT